MHRNCARCSKWRIAHRSVYHHVGTNNAVYSNERGIFTILYRLLRIECSYIGYASAGFTITSNTDTTLTILLASNNIIEKLQWWHKPQKQIHQATMRELTAIPALEANPMYLKLHNLPYRHKTKVRVAYRSWWRSRIISYRQCSANM